MNLQSDLRKLGKLLENKLPLKPVEARFTSPTPANGKYVVKVYVGTRLWSRSHAEFELGRFCWLWRAKLVAWWHVQKFPYREALITMSEQGEH